MSRFRDVTLPRFRQAARHNFGPAPIGQQSAGLQGTARGDHSHALNTVSATVLTSETTTSTSYTDLATVGPSVTATVGASGTILVGIYCGCQNGTAGDGAFMSFTGTGISAADAIAVGNNVGGSSATRQGGTFYFTGVTPGSYTVTAKYRVSTGGTGTFQDRRLWVISL